MARYEYSDGYTADGELRGAHKFWEITLAGTKVVLRYGRLGQKGQRRIKVYDSDDAARRAAVRMVARKEKEGYRYIEGSPPPPTAEYVPPPRAEHHGLLAQIHATPTEPDPYLVYADYLQSEGDPLGELIALGHALFGETDIPRFIRLQARRDELLATHKRHLFGALAEYLHEVKLDWRFGVVQRATLTRAAPNGLAGPYDLALVQSVLSAPVCCALQALRFEDPAANVPAVLALLPPAEPTRTETPVGADGGETTSVSAPISLRSLAVAADHDNAIKGTSNVDISEIVRRLPNLRSLMIGGNLSVSPQPGLEHLELFARDLIDEGSWPALTRLHLRFGRRAGAEQALDRCAQRMPKLEHLVLINAPSRPLRALVDHPILKRLHTLELVGPMSESDEERIRAAASLEHIPEVKLRLS